jgi:hypothetical protein
VTSTPAALWNIARCDGIFVECFEGAVVLTSSMLTSTDLLLLQILGNKMYYGWMIYASLGGIKVVKTVRRQR